VSCQPSKLTQDRVRHTGLVYSLSWNQTNLTHTKSQVKLRKKSWSRGVSCADWRRCAGCLLCDGAILLSTAAVYVGHDAAAPFCPARAAATILKVKHKRGGCVVCVCVCVCFRRNCGEDTSASVDDQRAALQCGVGGFVTL